MDKVAKAMRDLGRAQGEVRRDEARVSAMKRKEEYLGARVPRELRAKVIARAGELGLPVSILIRNILEDAFSPVAQVNQSPEVAQPASAALNGYPNVIGWDQITLNRAMDCAGCAQSIEAGVRVSLGLTGPAEDHVILCGNCKVSV